MDKMNEQTLANFWTKKFSGLQHAYDYTRDPTKFEEFAAKFVEAKSDVLEIGSGVGRFLKLALERNAKLVVGVDPRYRDPDFKSRVEASAQPCLELSGELWHDIHFGAQQFDVVFSQSVFHFFDKAQRRSAFRKVRESLRSDGLFAISLKSVDSFFLQKGEGEMVDPGDNRWLFYDATGVPVVRKFFYVGELLAELEAVGFISDGNSSVVRARPCEGYGVRGEWSIWIDLILERGSDGAFEQ